MTPFGPAAGGSHEAGLPPWLRVHYADEPLRCSSSDAIGSSADVRDLGRRRTRVTTTESRLPATHAGVVLVIWVVIFTAYFAAIGLLAATVWPKSSSALTRRSNRR